MRTRILLAALLFGFAHTSFAIEAKDFNIQTLPTRAQQFIGTYFDDCDIISMKKNHKKSFQLLSKDGKEFVFDAEGNWVKIDCRDERVPSPLIPSEILNQVAKKFGTAVMVVRISISRKSTYNVELSNFISLKFDKHFKLLKYTNN